ncbi:MAG TPA: metallophosphoesterase [Acidimicrobiales bacterium]|nr:metallophosphoesterase [Acidimicrobiales bacterium]
MPARVTVVSDTHLAERSPSSVEQWDAVLAHLAADPPDLVVHAGDISCDGCVEPDDLAFSRDHLARVPVPLVSVPGNHDIGESAVEEGYDHALIDADRLARYRATLGTDRFSVTAGAWRIVGLDAQVLDSGLPDEADQWAWLESELDPGRADGPVALVLHKPVVPPPGQVHSLVRYVSQVSRDRLLALLAPAGGRLVVTGHVHQAMRHVADGLDHVWAPTSWALLPDRIQARVGDKVVGVVALTLHDDGRVDSEVQRPSGIRQGTLGDDVEVPFEGLPPAPM